MERAFHRVLDADRFERAEAVAYAGRTDPVIFESVAAALGVDRRTFDHHRDELEQIFIEALEAEMRRPDPRRRILPGVLPLLDRLAL